MKQNNVIDIWEGLAPKYLDKYDIWEYLLDKKGKRKHFVNSIKQTLFDEVWNRMKGSGENKNPFLESKNSKFIREDRKTILILDNKTDKATLENKGTHFEIRINKNEYNNKKSYKKRSYIAHELGHTFLYNTESTPIKPYFKYPEGRLYFFSNSTQEIYRKEEGFIFEIALHILAPDEFLRRIVSPNPSLDEFLKACNEFKITREMMVRRLYWYVYNWATGENYWSNSVLYFYPYNGDNSFIRHPKGNKEVFRGCVFKKERSFGIEEYWYKMIDLVIDALDSPGNVISKDLILSKKTFKVEAIYLPNEARFLIMVQPLT